MNMKEKKKFEFSKFKQRHIALKILYFGWYYDGLADQADNNNTVEHHVISALEKTCLIESRQTCRFSRCGRTDKGVSSYAQVVNLDVRSNLFDEAENFGLFTPDNYTGATTQLDKATKEELKYVDMINGLLPKYIRAIAWAPVRRDFSSRFNCQSRSYSYLFPKGDLCIDSMKKASEYLVGTHDFRNLCSLDLKNGVVNHVRTIYSTCIKPLDESQDNQYSFYEFTITGKAFLYHQIRCIMTILFLVARRRETPEIVRDMLDMERCPAKPKYCPASPIPLSLYACDYPAEDLKNWQYDSRTLSNIHKHLKKLWCEYKTKTEMIMRNLVDIEGITSAFFPQDLQVGHKVCWKDFGLEHDNMSDAKYTPIMKRQREESLEEKLEVISRKAKIQRSAP